MTDVVTATTAYVDQCTAYAADPQRPATPPAPPALGQGAEALSKIAQALAITIELARTGTTNPSPESVLDAGRLLDCIDERGQLDRPRYQRVWTELDLPA
jgi:hypothetical protein